MKATIFIVAHDKLPEHVGGPIVWLKRFVPELLEQGFAVNVALFAHCDQKKGQLFEFFSNTAANVFSTGFSKDLEYSVDWLLEVFQENPSNVFIPNVSPAAYCAGHIIRERYDIPIIGVLHSDDAFHHGLLKTFGSGRFAVDHFVCVSSALTTIAEKAGLSSRRLSRIPCGTPLSKTSARWQSERIHAIYAGRLEEKQKRISAVVETFISCERSISGFKASVIGSGSAMESLHQRLIYAESKSVSLCGPLPPDKVFEKMLSAQAFVLLSEYEGIPIALMEAMSCGLVPIVRRMRSGINELVIENETGFIVDRDDQVKDIITRLSSDEELWVRLSINAIKLVEKDFSSETSAKRWAELINRLHRSPRKPPREITKVIPKLNWNLKPFDSQLPHSKRQVESRFLQRIRKKGSHYFEKFLETVEEHVGANESNKDDTDGFIKISDKPFFADRISHRRNLLASVNSFLPFMEGRLLDAGCGKMPYKELILNNSSVTEYVGLDIEGAIEYDATIKPDFTWDGVRMPFEDNEFGCCIATEVLEHCPDPTLFLREVSRVVMPGGAFLFTVPFLWNLHEVPHDEYRYTPFAIERLLSSTSYELIQISPLGGWHASMSQMLGLWSRRSPMRRSSRLLVSILAKPVMRCLEKMEQKSNVTFKEGQMISGCRGIAFVKK